MKVEILKTTDYDMFKSLEGNRKVKANAKLAESMRKVNLIDYRPMIVDEDMRVIDGQHRLEAAKAAGLPVSYVILPKSVCDAEKAMLMLNINQKGWKNPDYVHHWAQKGIREYVELEAFTINSHLSASSVYRFYGVTELTGPMLRSGVRFEINPDAYKILDFLRSDEVSSVEFSRSRDFCRALKEVFEKWAPAKIARLKENMPRVRKATDAKEYLLEFNRISRKVRSDKQ